MTAHIDFLAFVSNRIIFVFVPYVAFHLEPPTFGIFERRT